jgi:hypothetical protein
VEERSILNREMEGGMRPRVSLLGGEVTTCASPLPYLENGQRDRHAL